MLAGTVELSTISDANLGAFSDALFFMNLPYLFKGTAGLRKVIDDPSIRDGINKTLAKRQPAGAHASRQRRAAAVSRARKAPSRRPPTAKDLKCRTTASPVEVAIFKGFGTIPTPINWAEVYTALSQGTVECEGVQYTWVYSTRHYEVLKHITEIGYVIGTQNMLNPSRSSGTSCRRIFKIVMTQAARRRGSLGSEDRRRLHARGPGEKIIRRRHQGLHAERRGAEEVADSVVPKVWDQFKDKVPPEFIRQVQKIQEGI
jgi:hypothetical protein